MAYTENNEIHAPDVSHATLETVRTLVLQYLSDRDGHESLGEILNRLNKLGAVDAIVSRALAELQSSGAVTISSSRQVMLA